MPAIHPTTKLTPCFLERALRNNLCTTLVHLCNSSAFNPLPSSLTLLLFLISRQFNWSNELLHHQMKYAKWRNMETQEFTDEEGVWQTKWRTRKKDITRRGDMKWKGNSMVKIKQWGSCVKFAWRQIVLLCRHEHAVNIHWRSYKDCEHSVFWHI